MPNVFQISCDFTLPEITKSCIGQRLQTILSKKGTFSMAIQPNFSIIGEMLLVFFNEKTRTHLTMLVTSRGHESYAGNLFGSEISIFPEDGLRYDQHGFNFRIINDFGIIIKVVGLGETCTEDVITEGREEEIEPFFPEGTTLPDVISIDKKTLEVIGFLFNTGKWLYLFSEGEGYFRIEFESNTTPEEMITRWDFVEMEKSMQILQVFE
jgi:hypothetical protein